jgi:K+-sensing histidine kinase KdpD
MGPAPATATAAPWHRRHDFSARHGFLLATIVVAVAFAVRLALKPLIGNASPFLVFTPALMVAAFYGGPAPGALATVLSALLGSHFFLRALGEPGVETWDRVALFLLVGTSITSLSGVVRTTRRRLAESLWREQKGRAQAEAANQAKDDFLALVSHELQTPVSVVIGWTSTIRMCELGGKALLDGLDAIEGSARVLSKLVEDVMDTSRILSGTLRLDSQVVSLSTVVRSAIEQLRPTIHGHQLRLDVDLVDEKWPVRADPPMPLSPCPTAAWVSCQSSYPGSSNALNKIRTRCPTLGGDLVWALQFPSISSSGTAERFALRAKGRARARASQSVSPWKWRKPPSEPTRFALTLHNKYCLDRIGPRRSSAVSSSRNTARDRGCPLWL